jgi:hypothetical protein
VLCRASCPEINFQVRQASSPLWQVSLPIISVMEILGRTGKRAEMVAR